ncbi:MAG: NAD(+) synthase [Pseudomonadota bacterium]
MTDPVNHADLGFIRVAAACPRLALGNPTANAAIIAEELALLREEGVQLAVFPELCLTGYSCEDLFFAGTLYEQLDAALDELARATTDITAVVGAPWRTRDGRTVNAALVLRDGRLHGVVPKAAHPNYGEFYERRWFTALGDHEEPVEHSLGSCQLGHRQLFEQHGIIFGVEICEDLWAIDNPGADLAIAGALITANLSASNELVAKAEYRSDLVRMTSAQRLCGYVYASAGLFESSKDIVYGGHCMIAENGQLLLTSERFSLENTRIISEIDCSRLRHDRAHNNTFQNAPRSGAYDLVPVTGADSAPPKLNHLRRRYGRHPFLPATSAAQADKASEILAIQSAGLARRMLSAPVDKLIIGISGGLDSTLALLVCLECQRRLDRPTADIHALTMPGPGTTSATLETARALAAAAGVTLTEISIEPAVTQHLLDLSHDGGADTVFENAQARERTQLLFNYANKVGGLVVGTGDLSELALGWCTFNADQMANYNVNASVPKTLVRFIVDWYRQTQASDALGPLLETVIATPITPELLPVEDDQTAQLTEELVGPYELHDFFLFHWLRYGATPEKIHTLAGAAFAGDYDAATIKRWLKVFFQRFFASQFKRTTLPPGPKVGSVSLSPRGDWRLPDEVDSRTIIAAVDALPTG